MKKLTILFLMTIVYFFPSVKPCSLDDEGIKKEQLFSNRTLPENLPLMNIDFVAEDLVSVIQSIAATLKINIIFPQGSDEIKQKITFKQQKNPVTFKEGIRLIETFLDLAGYALVSKNKALYAIVRLKDQYQISEPLPLYVNISPEEMPFSDAPARAIFYLSNLKVPSDTLKKVLDEVLSSEKSYSFDSQTNGIIITDKTNLIISAMKFITELDQMGSQTRVEFIQLYNASAPDLVELIKKQIIGISDNPTPFIFNEAKTESAVFFPKSLRLAAEPRTNSIVVMGKQSAVERMQEFIRNVLDLPLDTGSSVLHVYDLQYLIAVDLEAVLKSVFTNSSTDQSTNQAINEIFRGVQIFAERPVEQAAEQSPSGTGNVNAGSQMTNISRGGNRILVAALEADWKRVKNFLDEIDKPQDQVILEALLVDVEISQLKSLGTQIRSNNNDRFGAIAGTFQSAQLAPMITTPYAPSTTPTLEADLLSKVFPPASPTESLAAYLSNKDTGNPGSLILSLGSNTPEAGSVSAVMKILDSITNAKVLSHPFVVTSNNQTATMVVKSIRRGPADATVVASGGAINIAQVDIEANLTLTAIPRVSSNDRLNLTLKITAEQFTNPAGTGTTDASLTKLNRIVETNANIGTGDILVLGGLGRDAIKNSEYRWPVLSKIPLLGWLFKSRSENFVRSTLIVFIVPTIVHAHLPDGMDRFTEAKLKEGEDQLDYNNFSEPRDPITRLFFKKRSYSEKELVSYVKSRQQIKDEQLNYTFLQKNITKEENPLVKKK